VQVVKCFHTVSTVGYVLLEKRAKLNPSYSSLSGIELKNLRSEGVDVTVTVEIPLLAYLCDSTIQVLEEDQAALIFSCPVVMIECTYLEPDKSDEARKRGHICWSHLAPHVESHPDIVFILFHFSQRYTDQEIRVFFKTAARDGKTRPSNVVLWLDTGLDLSDSLSRTQANPTTKKKKEKKK